MDAKPLIKKILLCFEQSSPTIKYGEIYTLDDGPNDIKQITVSFGITEYGNLKRLVTNYISNNGLYAEELKTNVDKIGKTSLVNNRIFINTLKSAGSDIIMQKLQEELYDTLYINPAYKFCEDNGFTTNLAKLVICDSYLHSGSVPASVRGMFPAKTPKNGGDEKEWVTQYVKARKQWLANHSRVILHKTVYRMDFMLLRIQNNDWDLSKLPYIANDVNIIG